ncbi:MAG: hypothetical protein Q4A66_10235 [Eubacteriales bacterium]|nr:hypothetical protein [Eubacteriales bacterium]
MRILIDMDDTLEQLVVGWIAFLNEKYGTQICPCAVKDWDMCKAFPSLTRSQVYSALDEDALWEHVPPMPGAVETVKRLMDDGHEIFIVTASGYKSLCAKMEKVLFRYFPYLSWEQVIVTSQKTLIDGDLIIDDGPHNLCGRHRRKILFSAAHNLSFDESTVGAVRAGTWDEVYNEITRLA